MELLLATASLLALTIVASLIYHRRIKQAQGEYEGAKDLVKNITMGFSKQASRLDKTMTRVERETSMAKQTSTEALKRGEDALNISSESLKATKSIANRLDETDKAVESVKAEIQKLARGAKPSVVKKDVEGPIPLQQESVLEQLTETEVEVLAIIDELVEASVPEIRERIKKTREHTARLLKKLYEKGFIDRNTSGMPYKYHIRKEIKEAIQQQKKKINAVV